MIYIIKVQRNSTGRWKLKATAKKAAPGHNIPDDYHLLSSISLNLMGVNDSEAKLHNETGRAWI